MKNTAKSNNVVYDESVKLMFFELIDALYQKEYFSFLYEAKEYVSEIERYFKENLFFVAYRRTKSRTTWYAFFEIFNENYFKVVHITNNHTKDVAYIEH